MGSRRLSTLRLISWNVYVGNSPRTIRAALIVLATLFRPHVIALQEARRFDGTIPGYKRYAADQTKRPDADQQVILVRGRRRRNLKHRTYNVPGDGWHYEGNPKPPRTFNGVGLTVGGLWWNVLDVHRCVGGPNGNSPDEWWAEDELIANWFATAADGPAVAVGDWNDQFKSLADGSVADLARRVDADGLLPGDGIDYALVKGCGGKVRKLARMFGSDHAPVLYTLKARRPLDARIVERLEKQPPLPEGD